MTYKVYIEVPSDEFLWREYDGISYDTKAAVLPVVKEAIILFGADNVIVFSDCYY